MTPKKPFSAKPVGAIGDAGKIGGKRYAKSYYEEQMEMQRRIQKEQDNWDRAKKQWKKAKNSGQGVA